MVLMYVNSERKSTGSGCRGNFTSPVAKMPSLLYAAGRSLSEFELYPYAVFRRHILSPTSGTRSAVAMSNLQQIGTF